MKPKASFYFVLYLIGIVNLLAVINECDFALVFAEYRNLGADWFRLSAQYSRMLSLGAWAKIVPRYVFAEVKYSTVLLRNPKPWEQSDYLYATLGFNFDF